MITFLPYPDFRQSLEALDRQRLGRQRLEAFQIYDALIDPGGKYARAVRGPAVRMWKGCEGALAAYYNMSLIVWAERGYRNEKLLPVRVAGEIDRMPGWWGDDRVHGSHRSQLLAKLPAHYEPLGWKDVSGLPYYWPV